LRQNRIAFCGEIAQNFGIKIAQNFGIKIAKNYKPIGEIARNFAEKSQRTTSLSAKSHRVRQMCVWKRPRDCRHEKPVAALVK
jgi:hypothetical protein